MTAYIVIRLLLVVPTLLAIEKYIMKVACQS